MATAQPSKSSTGNRSKKSQGSSARGAGSQTGERDENYNLISVLYHALQGAETISQYQQDADGDSELSSFFEETKSSYVLVAQQAKQLLAARIESDEDEDEDEDDSE
jgi:hypothetical protein